MIDGMRVLIKSLLRTCLLLVLLGVVAGMVVPYSTIEYVLREFKGVKHLLNFLDTVAPGFELDHLLSFGVLGFVAHFAWRKGRAWQVAAGILAVAALVETVQIWIPGREAAVSHAILAFLGGVVGFTAAWLSTYAWGGESVPDEYQQSTHWAGQNSHL
jgi:hypothetical protein